MLGGARAARAARAARRSRWRSWSRDLAEAERLCVVSTAERELLGSPARPIVLLGSAGRRGPRPVDEVAPRLRELGVMLPYTPLHHLLLEAVGGRW